MRVRALSASGDWTFGQGASNYKTAQAAADQCIQTRLASFLGDCFFDQGAGIDWFNLLGGKDQTALLLAIQATILNTVDQNGNPVVTGINQLSLTVNAGRQVFVSYQVATVYSTITNVFQYDLGGSPSG